MAETKKIGAATGYTPPVGPPAPRDRYDNLPREMRAEDERRMPKSDLLAALLALSGGMDIYATEESLPRLNPGRELTLEEMVSAGYGPETTSATWEVKEGNPLPGMQHPVGRLAYGALENRGLAELRQRKPAVGIPATLAATLAHLFLANQWRRNVKEKGR